MQLQDFASVQRNAISDTSNDAIMEMSTFFQLNLPKCRFRTLLYHEYYFNFIAVLFICICVLFW